MRPRRKIDALPSISPDTWKQGKWGKGPPDSCFQWTPSLEFWALWPYLPIPCLSGLLVYLISSVVGVGLRGCQLSGHGPQGPLHWGAPSAAPSATFPVINPDSAWSMQTKQGSRDTSNGHQNAWLSPHLSSEDLMNRSSLQSSRRMLASQCQSILNIHIFPFI